jgi:SAM-dependent methyltransferase
MAREILGPRQFPREPEPALVMDDPGQVTAYADAGRVDGTMAAGYLFNSAQITHVIQGCHHVLDLGCGPATQLAQVAELNPDTQFLGVDLSPSMLASARTHIGELGLKNVSLRQSDITDLDGIRAGSMDAVISTLTLHHLPSHRHLLACFREVSRVLRSGGRIYLVDFGRLKSLRSVLFFAYMNAAHQPHVFSLDYERSLRAAFLLEDLKDAAALLPSAARVYHTFKVPFLVIIKTPSAPIAEWQSSRLAAMRASLPKRYRQDLDELRLFFRLGGLEHDPFLQPTT